MTSATSGTLLFSNYPASEASHYTSLFSYHFHCLFRKKGGGGLFYGEGIKQKMTDVYLLGSHFGD